MSTTITTTTTTITTTIMTPKNRAMTKYIANTSTIILLYFLATVEAICPKRCNCDETLLEVTCHEPIGLQGVPITLNPQTKRVYIKNNNLTTFNNIEIYIHLEHLDLSHNNIQFLNLEKLETNAHLRIVNASHNGISELIDTGIKITPGSPQTPEGYTVPSVLPSKRLDIHSLILDHNNLQTIVNFLLYRLPELRELDVSHNKIQSIDQFSLLGAHQLERLILRGNRLTQVPTVPISNLGFDIISHSNTISLQYPVNLKTLDLSHNAMPILPSYSFMSLVALRELYLEECGINSIEDKAFEGLESLLLLSLDKNYLEIVPSKALSSMKKIVVLQMNQNLIADLPPRTFANLATLEDLQLNNQSLSIILEDSLFGLRNLKKLEISSNVNLSTIEKGALSNLTRLVYLNLNSNALTSISGDLANSTHLKLVDLRHNPLNCQCNLRWLSNWLRHFDNKTIVYQSKSVPYHSAEPTGQFSDPNQYANLQLEDEEIEFESWFNDSALTRDLVDLKCNKPAALSGQLLINMHLDRLECLEPTSELQVQIGIGALLTIITLIVIICIISFCFRRKDLLIVLKENILHRQSNHHSMVPPYEQDKPKAFDDFKNGSTLFTINTGAHHMYDTNLSYGEINDYSSAIYDDRLYQEPDLGISDRVITTRTYTDL